MTKKRKEIPAKRLLLIDNYDSFTYNLYDYFRQLGADCRVERNDTQPPESYRLDEFDALVLSPGPERPADAGALMPILHRFREQCPILGICLGHQAIGEEFGARLVKAPEPVHGKTSAVWHEADDLFTDVSSPFEAMRYHSLIVQDFRKTPLRVIARTEEGIAMAIRHRELPITGIQFHPESIGTPDGLQILRNWLQSV